MNHKNLFQEVQNQLDSMTDEEKRSFFEWLNKMGSDIAERRRKLSHFYTADWVGGVYAITNVKNNKKYIGQSECIHKRISTHRIALSNGYHNSSSFQNDYNQYGPDVFEITILEEIKDKAKRLSKECQWICKYSPDQLYNSAQDYKRAQHAQSKQESLSD
jgi:predicted GIY-YIG superfamily endonuclease